MPADLNGLKCPTCNYDLTGLREHRCPECGGPFDAAMLRQIADAGPRPRHRWVRVTVALSLLIFEAFAYMGTVRNSGMPEVVAFASACVVPIVLVGLIIMSSYWTTWGLLRRDARETIINITVAIASFAGLVFWYRLAYLIMKSAG